MYALTIENDRFLTSKHEDFNTRVYSVKMFVIFNKFVKFRPIKQAFGYGKYVRKSQEELAEELRNKQNEILQSAITSALKNRKYLNVNEWKLLSDDLAKQNLFLRTPINLYKSVFKVLLNLRSPYDSMQNALNFIEANNIKNDLFLKQRMIQFYAKKATEVKLSEEEEKQLIEMYVNKIDLFFIVK